MRVIEQRVAGAGSPLVSVPADTDEPAHWRCPDCFQPCRCTPDFRDLLPHVRCGLKEES